MSFLHVFSASLEGNEMKAEQYLFSRSAFVILHKVALTFELVCHGGHANPKKHRVVYNFLSFYSVILKLGTKKELVIL